MALHVSERRQNDEIHVARVFMMLRVKLTSTTCIALDCPGTIHLDRSRLLGCRQGLVSNHDEHAGCSKSKAQCNATKL